MTFRATRAFRANNIALTRSIPFAVRRTTYAQLGLKRQVARTTSERMRAIQYACFTAGSRFPLSLAPDTAENIARFSAALASAASNPTTALTARFLFDRGIVSISARFRAPRPFAHACARASIPVRTRYEPGWAPPRPAPPLSRFSRHGEGEDYTRTFGVGVVTRVAFCVYNTKCRRKAASWLLRSMTLRSHFGTCPAPAGKCALKRDIRSLSFANKAQLFALASGYNHSRRLPIGTNAGD